MTRECSYVFAPCDECDQQCITHTINLHRDAHSASIAQAARYDRIITYAAVAAYLFALAGIVSIIPEAWHRQTLSYQTP